VTGSSAELIRCRNTGTFQESVVADAEAAFVRAGLVGLGSGRPNAVLDTAGRVLGRAGLLRRVRATGRIRVAALLGPAERQLIPYGLRGRTAWYVWDCWPTAERRWASMFERWQPAFVFFTARAAAEYWGPRLPFARVVWSPEAVEPSVYPPGQRLVGRSVVLTEMGRRHPGFHVRAAEHMTRRNATHLFSTQEQRFLFPSRDSLAQGLADSVASVCYPGALSDPSGRTGPWETMTHRYLEAAATRTLIVGAIPSEMIDLFGFTPGLNINPDSPGEILDKLIDDPGQFQDLVDRTYRRLLEVGTWDVRVAQILSRIADPQAL
jgi:hypothetical protein